jgi:hypothetical protein
MLNLFRLIGALCMILFCYAALALIGAFAWLLHQILALLDTRKL